MRSLLVRLATLSAFTVSLTACSTGGGSLPFAGPPNNAGGSPGTIQTGANGVALLRVVEGSPDYTAIDICVDQAPFGNGSLTPTAAYGTAASSTTASPQIPPNTLAAITAATGSGFPHTIAVYPSLIVGGAAGAECATAPGPYLGVSPIKVTTLAAVASARYTVVLGGTAATKTLGLYVFGDPTFPTPPGLPLAISHNAAPAFSTATGTTVGFGYLATVGGAPTPLTGATSVPQGKISRTSSATVNPAVQSPIGAIAAAFFDGPPGGVVPITTVAAPLTPNGQPPVFQLYAIDGPAGGLNLVVVPEVTNGFGF